LEEAEVDWNGPIWVNLARHIVEKAKSYSCSSRSITVTNDKLLKKTEKMKLANRSNTGLFAQALLLIRRQMKHRGLQLIKPGDKDWLDLKEPCQLATEFCNEFGYSLKEGYREYVKLAMGMMQKYSIYKLKSLHGAICNKFEALQEIAKDRYPKDSERVHDYYLSKISEKTGFSQGYKDNPEKYVYFVRANDTIRKLAIQPEKYIDAQFWALEWANGIPDPMQLVGTKASERFQKFAFENGIRLGEKKQGINFKRIKDARKNISSKR
jgi:hypothetical protein